MTDHAALRAEIARAQKPVTTRKLPPKTLYERGRSVIQYVDNRDANGPALLVTAGTVAPDGVSIGCTSIIYPHPQLTSLTLARGLRSDRAVWRSRRAV